MTESVPIFKKENFARPFNWGGHTYLPCKFCGIEVDVIKAIGMRLGTGVIVMHVECAMENEK